MIFYRVERPRWRGKFHINEMGVHFAEDIEQLAWHLYRRREEDRGKIVEAKIDAEDWPFIDDMGQFSPETIAMSMYERRVPDWHPELTYDILDQIIEADQEGRPYSERSAITLFKKYGIHGVAYQNVHECPPIRMANKEDCISIIVFDPADIHVKRTGMLYIDEPEGPELEYEVEWK
jgi:hypothetical protein